MKLVIDERVKHRLIGLLVILSLGAIFTPAIIKKSNQRFDNSLNVSVELPDKPLLPKVASKEKKIMFEEVKLTKLELPAEVQPQDELNIAKAKSLSKPVEVALESEIPTLRAEKVTVEPVTAIKEVDLALVNPPLQSKNDVDLKALAEINKPIKEVKVVKVASLAKPTAPKAKAPIISKPKIIASKNVASKASKNTASKSAYAVQLATFSKKANAHSLVSKLKTKGYKAKYNEVKTASGTMYKVIVGSLNRREEAQVLQKKLASSIQINGFIVTTGQG